MLSIIISLSNSNLRPFLSTSYSLELYFRLSEAKNGRGIEELYNSLCSPKPKQQSFDRFIKLLADKKLIDLEPVLAKIVETNVEDVRQYLS